MEPDFAVVDGWVEMGLAALGLRVLAALLIVLAGIVLARIASGVLHRVLLRTPVRNRRLLLSFLERTARVVVVVFASVVALGELGLDIGPLIAGIGITGFIVGFAFKDSLSNLAAGLLLLFYQPFDVGDFVEAGGQTGSVLNMTIVATELKLPDGRLAIVPNSKIWNASIINFNRLGTRRIEWTVGIDYGADIGAAMEAVRAAVTADPRVLAEPEPQLVVNALGESSVDLVVRAWVEPKDFGGVTSDVRRSVKEALDARGISIPFPHRVVMQKQTA